MVYNSQGQAKKSLYIFLTAILGVLLFLILHRLAVFVYLTLVAVNYPAFGSSFSYPQFLAFDYLTLDITLMLGAWYGIWLGLYWYHKIYEEGSYGGFAAHIAGKIWPKGSNYYNLKSKIEKVSRQLEEDVARVEDLGKSLPQALVSPAAIKRRAVRKSPLKANRR